MSEIVRDTVFVRGLLLDAEIGVLEHEKGRRQPLVVDIVLEVEVGPPVEGDLASVFDYRMPVEAARALVAEGHVELVETFVERLAAACLRDASVRTATIRAEKPEAIPGAAGAGVEIVRRRSF